LNNKVSEVYISEINRLRAELDAVKQELRRVETQYTFDDLAGNSELFLSTVQTAKNAALTSASILIEGESGTGKSILARAIHNASRRWSQNFIEYDCSFDEEFIESGNVWNIFKSADRGTIYLSNIDRLPYNMQEKLLQTMINKEVRLPGASGAKKIDLRFIFSTKENLKKFVPDGRISRELYDRLSVFRFFLPPLRERKEDIEIISQYFINRFNTILNRNIEGIDSEAIKLLTEQNWPGNIRELESVISKTIVNMEQGEKQIKKSHIIIEAHSGLAIKLNDAVAETEKVHIVNALKLSGGDKSKAAAALDIPLRTLYYKCKRLGIEN